MFEFRPSIVVIASQSNIGLFADAVSGLGAGSIRRSSHAPGVDYGSKELQL
jgi:hypothetical protein